MATRKTDKMHAPGDFTFMKNKMWGKTCADGYRAVDKLELWKWLATYDPETGFMFCAHPNMDLITNELDSNPHSGASWGCMIRTLQYIAVNGWPAYVLNAE